MSKSHAAAHVDNDSFYLVDSSSFEACDSEFWGVWYSVYKFMMLISLFIKFEPFQMGK